jgi:hypothetical protein
MSSGNLRRGRLSDEQLTRLAAHLTGRDRQIALDCYEHTVLTTGQLGRLHFTGIAEQTARRRLLMLHELRVLDRFRPLLPRGQGSAPHYWVLDEAGAHIVAAEHQIPRAELRYQHAAALSVADSIKLTHHIEVNEFFCRLHADAARAGGKLAEWYGERTLHSFFHGRLAPDSYGVLRLPDQPAIHLLLELDRGTETSQRLREKAVRYASALPRSTLREHDPLVILTVPSAARGETATTAIADTRAPITVVVWSAAATRSTLQIVTDAARRHARRSALLSV